MTSLKRFGPILHSKWKADENCTEVIFGYWAEDFSRFEIQVPSQLRSFIIELQNRAHAEYIAQNKDSPPWDDLEAL